MRDSGTEMNVTWKSGAKAAFEDAGFHDKWDNQHNGITLRPHIIPGRVVGLHLVFPVPNDARRNESQVHIDYRPIYHGHGDVENDNVLSNMEKYKDLYESLPGLIP